jgi:hypothetical protein
MERDTMSNDYFDFAASLARAQAGYDAKTPPDDPAICGYCLGTGKFGCTIECAEGGIEDYKFCKRHHRCPGKCIDGKFNNDGSAFTKEHD